MLLYSKLCLSKLKSPPMLMPMSVSVWKRARHLNMLTGNLPSSIYCDLQYARQVKREIPSTRTRLPVLEYRNTRPLASSLQPGPRSMDCHFKIQMQNRYHEITLRTQWAQGALTIASPCTSKFQSSLLQGWRMCLWKAVIVRHPLPSNSLYLA